MRYSLAISYRDKQNEPVLNNFMTTDRFTTLFDVIKSMPDLYVCKKVEEGKWEITDKQYATADGMRKAVKSQGVIRLGSNSRNIVAALFDDGK